jgi:hypothetical protein
MQMEEQKKENLNLKSQYDMDTHNFKNELEKKTKAIGTNGKRVGN